MSDLRTLMMCAALAVLLVPFSVTAQAEAGVTYELFIDCPEIRTNLNSRPQCPVRAIDEADIMGDPSLAVDPLEPENLIIASLHGAVGRNGTSPGGPGANVNNIVINGPACPPQRPGPTMRSRCGQPFTTFTSTDSGQSWVDNPFVAPSEVSGAYGEHPQLTIDPYGRVYVGSLYAQPRGDGAFDYTIVAQKFSSLQNINSEQDGEYNAEYLDPVYRGNSIGQMWFLFNPQTDNMTMVWHEQVTSYSEPKDLPIVPDCKPKEDRGRGSTSTSSTSSSSSSTSSSSSSSSSTGSSTSSSSSTGSSTGSSTSGTSSSTSTSTGSSSSTSTSPSPLPLGLLASPSLLPDGGLVSGPAPSPAERADDQPETELDPGPRSVIGVVWTAAASGSCYQYQPYEWIIGPCHKSTNPVLSEGWLYVGCVARTDEGEFKWNKDTVDGNVEMFRMRPDGGEPQYIGSSRINGGAPKLGVRSDGRLALATTTTEDGILGFEIDFGKYDPESKRIEWSSRNSFGGKIEKVDPALKILDSNIQDLIYREHSGVVHLILKERIAPGTGLNAAQYATAPQFRKFIVAVSEEWGVLAKVPLDIGNIINRTDSTLLQSPEEAFNDLSDDFLQHPNLPEFRYTDPRGIEHVIDNYQREFFAVADYGIVIFAELMEITNLRGPAFANPGGPPVPQPAPAASSAVTNVTVPTAGLTMAGALALALLSVKRKEAALVRAGRGKKRY